MQQRLFCISIFFTLFTLILAGCGGSSGGSGPTPATTPTTPAGLSVGTTAFDVREMIYESTDKDSDNDYLPDDVEIALGTDPNNKDSDGDGQDDYTEIFDVASDAEPITDFDQDLIIAPLDNDDDGDGYNDGSLIDSDGDGISNYLEMYGYTFNVATGQYHLWDGINVSEKYYKSDPTQKSSDQDPFDDNVEVSTVNMDVSIAEPGNTPMVPAYPDIEVRLEGYTVTLNEEITWSRGESFANGTSWDSSTESSHSFTDESNWEVGISESISVSPTGFGAEVKVNASYGESNSTTNATSTSQSLGGTSLSQEEWSRATATNPTDVAHIKLFLKVYNHGTAVASNIMPTLTLQIGGHNIATFEPGNAQVNLLAPGETYPSTPGVYWVADSIDTGAGVVDISLTLNELKALECGAPVRITMTQMLADVMQRDVETGVYQSVGDWNEYLARIKPVSASLYIDMGDGKLLRSFVYADDGPSAPLVSLGDAIVWAAGGHYDDNNNLLISYTDKMTGLSEDTIIVGEGTDSWSIVIDQTTYLANSATYLAHGYLWDEETSKWQLPEGVTDDDPLSIFDLRLTPKSNIIIKAPRPGGANELLPEIHYAFYDQSTGMVHAVATDYSGIKKVEFVDKNRISYPMVADVLGSDYFSFYPASISALQNYPMDGTELIRVTSVGGVTDQFPDGAEVEKEIYNTYKEELALPVISNVYYNVTTNTVTADIEWIDGDLDNGLAWVRIYHPGFYDPPDQEDDFKVMSHTFDYTNTNNIQWAAEIPEHLPGGNYGWVLSDSDLKIVAYTGTPGKYTEYLITDVNIVQPVALDAGFLTAVGHGEFTMYLYSTITRYYDNYNLIHFMDLDSGDTLFAEVGRPGDAGTYTSLNLLDIWPNHEDNILVPWVPAQSDPRYNNMDVLIRSVPGYLGDYRFKIFFNDGVSYCNVDHLELPTDVFDEISAQSIKANAVWIEGGLVGGGYELPATLGSSITLLVKTENMVDGEWVIRYAKLKLGNYVPYSDALGQPYWYYKRIVPSYQFVTYPDPDE